MPPSRRRKRNAKLNNKEKDIQDNSGSDAFERFESGSDADESLESSNDAYEDINLADKVESYLEGGPFFIKTAVEGPLINSDGNLVMADADLGMTRIGMRLMMAVKIDFIDSPVFFFILQRFLHSLLMFVWSLSPVNQ